MAPAGGRDDGDPRAAADDDAHSSSGDSEPEEDEIATISDVFADMLVANEDLLHAAAEYQLDSDVPSILAYQRILHRNLIEMADFVDSVFGVYNKPELIRMKDEDAMEDGDEKEEEEKADAHDDVNGHTSEESSEPAAAKKVQPVRMRSLLLDRFRLENKRRKEQRTARLWRKMRRKVRVEEGVSVVMTQAVERIAQMTVSAAAAREPPREAPVLDGRLAAKHSKPPTPDPPTTMTTTATAPTTTQATDSPQQPPHEVTAPANAPVVESTTALLAGPQPPPASTSSPTQPSTSGSTSTLLQAPLAQPSLPMSLLASSMPFAPQGAAMLMPVGANSFTKVPLPPMSSGLNIFYPMPAPTLFPPNHMSSVCADCVPLGRTANECRSILKHITPPPPPVQPMMLGAQSMWPMAFNGVMNTQQPVRSVPPMRTAQPAASSFKKMCEECKKNHKSVHHCRKILGHTAPEWLSGLPESDPKPRKRRSRRQKEMEEAAQRLAASKSAVEAEQVISTTNSASMPVNEI